MIEFNGILIIYLCVLALYVIFRSVLSHLNIRHLKSHGHIVPAVFKDEIDSSTLIKMSQYTIASNRLGAIENITEDVFILFIVLIGFLPWLSGLIESYQVHFILSGLIFFFIFSLITGLLEIPFDLYRNFILEKKFSFSTMTLKLWFSDLIKSILVSSILMGIFLSVFFSLVYYAPTVWWLYVWIFFISFQIFIIWLYPLVIAPLFNKFEPVETPAIKDKISSLMTLAGFHMKGLYKMDAGKRSRHTNAYFTGIGKSKRIVLYDTLINTHTPEEIEAVLAHELGHWKKGHIRKQIILTVCLSLIGLYALFFFVNSPVFYKSFGFNAQIIYAGILLISLVAKPFSFFLTPLGCLLSRYFERQADDYALDLHHYAPSLISALKHLAKDNLSNLHPHPLYAWFYYSHPPLVDRITHLQEKDRGKYHKNT